MLEAGSCGGWGLRIPKLSSPVPFKAKKVNYRNIRIEIQRQVAAQSQYKCREIQDRLACHI